VDISRRTVLKGMAAAAALTVARPATTAWAADGLATTIVNDTGAYANSQLRVHVVGTNLNTGEQCYGLADGTMVPVSPGLNGPDGYADLSMPLQDITIPRPMSGRVYFSVGTRLPFKVVTDGAGRPALQYPAGWVASDPSYGILHDWMEFTLNGAGMFCNSTAVDMFAMPIAVTLAGSAGTQTTGRIKAGGRDAVFAGVAAAPGFDRLVLPNRVIAPGHGIDAGLFDPNYLDGPIGAAWSTYTGRDLTVRTGAATRTGRVSGDVFGFDGGVAPIRRPSTRDAFFCDGALAAPNDGVTGPVAAVLGAALNRSTLSAIADQPATDPGTYYRESVTNHYARVLHEQHADGRAYGFAFDDVADHASYIQDTGPSQLTLTLEPF
jgi:hypothetical protein